ncbi:MAG: MFS transporter [Spirochaetes bacterium]|nr:MFS transporter [Spirochaetota bacterium]MBU1079829.1 MFS transporter [Spirochaetota bacterium]
MAKKGARFAFGSFFFFMLLHQTDKLLIGPLQSQIMDTFKINYTQWGLLNTSALVVGALSYPLWGWLYDHYARPKLLALASLIWGCTTWLNAVAPTYSIFLITRASTGIDDSSYPGIYSLISDYFPAKMRGKVYGFLQVAQPIGYLVGMVLAIVLGSMWGWRKIFYLTGGLGVAVAVVLFFGVKDQPRGASEPELAGVSDLDSKFKFSWKTVGGLFRKKSLIILFLQGFIGVFPWQVITYYIFAYLEKSRGFSGEAQLLTMVPAVLLMAVGYPVGGMIGDRLFKRTPKGRVIVGAAGVALGAVFLLLAIESPVENQVLFGAFLCVAAFFMPFASPNVISSFYDVTEPEIRATTNAVQNFIETAGSAAAPLLAGILADRFSLEGSILSICLGAWGLCFLFFVFAGRYIPKDIEDLKRTLRERASQA